MAGAIFIPSSFLHFCVTLIDERKKYFKVVVFWYFVSIFFLILDFFPIYIPDVRPRMIFSFWPTAGPAYAPFLAMFIGLTIYSHVLLFKHYRMLSGVKKNQIKYVFFGTAIGFIGGSTNYPLWYDVHILPVGNALVAIYVLTIAYSIIKYRLMDIRIAIARSAILIFTYSAIFSISILLFTGFKSELIHIVGEKWWLFPAIFYTIAITFAPFAYQKLQLRAENQILKNQKNAHTKIMSAASGITLVRDLHKLLNLTVRILTRTLGITHASIFLLDRNTDQYSFRATRGGRKIDAKIDSGNSLVKYLQGARKPLIYEEIRRQYDDRRDVFIKEIRDTMRRIKADLLVPSYIEDNLIGFLVLGPKRSGEIYSNEDLSVLFNLANQSALAIENAQFLKEREEVQAKLREIETLSVIRDLLGSLHHEMYNLLTQAVPTLELIGMGGYDNKPEKLKDDAKKAREKLLFIRTILGWIKEYEEKSRINKITAHRLSDMIDAAVTYLKDNIEKQKIKVEIDVGQGIFIIGQESLPLLFKHLAINSIYGYGMENGGTLSIKARVQEGHSMVEIIQTDTGQDLNEQINDGKTMGGKMFAEKGKIGGPSYFIAQAVATRHKGSLKVESMDGKGTKFKVLLPLDFNRARR